MRENPFLKRRKGKTLKYFVYGRGIYADLCKKERRRMLMENVQKVHCVGMRVFQLLWVRAWGVVQESM